MNVKKETCLQLNLTLSYWMKYWKNWTNKLLNYIPKKYENTKLFIHFKSYWIHSLNGNKHKSNSLYTIHLLKPLYIYILVWTCFYEPNTKWSVFQLKKLMSLVPIEPTKEMNLYFLHSDIKRLFDEVKWSRLWRRQSYLFLNSQEERNA